LESEKTMQEAKAQARVRDYLKTGNQLRKEAKLDQAIGQYQQALHLNPDFVPALSQLAGIYEDQKQFGKALPYREQAAGLQPKDGLLKAQLARTMMRLGKTQEAITLYQKAIALNEHLPTWAYNGLGNALAKNGQIEEAIASYEKALELQPDSPNLPQKIVQLKEAIEGQANDPNLPQKIGEKIKMRKIAIAARLRYLPENQQLVMDLYESLLGADEEPNSPSRTVDALTMLSGDSQQIELGKIYALWELGIEPIYIDDLYSVKATDEISEFHQQLLSLFKMVRKEGDFQSLEHIFLNPLTPDQRDKLLQAGLKIELVQKLFAQPDPDEVEISSYASSFILNRERFLMSDMQALAILTTDFQVRSICNPHSAPSTVTLAVPL
jgi:tetratricopeptide (TPR) repeat protein